MRPAGLSTSAGSRNDSEASAPQTRFMAAPTFGRPQPNLLSGLDASGRALVLARGRPKAFRGGQGVFRQGEQHDGIYLIESGLARVFYTAPAGQEITLAYWTAGNFCGGPTSSPRIRRPPRGTGPGCGRRRPTVLQTQRQFIASRLGFDAASLRRVGIGAFA